MLPSLDYSNLSCDDILHLFPKQISGKFYHPKTFLAIEHTFNVTYPPFHMQLVDWDHKNNLSYPGRLITCLIIKLLSSHVLLMPVFWTSLENQTSKHSFSNNVTS